MHSNFLFVPLANDYVDSGNMCMLRSTSDEYGGSGSPRKCSDSNQDKQSMTDFRSQLSSGLLQAPTYHFSSGISSGRSPRLKVKGKLFKCDVTSNQHAAELQHNIWRGLLPMKEAQTEEKIHLYKVRNLLYDIMSMLSRGLDNTTGIR